MTTKPHDDSYMELALRILWIGGECTTFTVRQIRLSLIEGKSKAEAERINTRSSSAKINWVLKCIGAERINKNGRYTIPYFHPNSIIFGSVGK